MSDEQEREPSVREELRRLVREYPYASAAEFARVLGVSRQRVAQIAADEGLELRRAIADSRGREHSSQRIPRQPVGRKPPPPPPVRTGGVDLPLAPAIRGTVGELLAAADLTARGFVVFFPLVRTAACDLVTLAVDGSLERIEVRRGNRRVDGKGVVWNSPDKSKSDRRAIVIVGDPVRYEPPFPDVAP